MCGAEAAPDTSFDCSGFVSYVSDQQRTGATPDGWGRRGSTTSARRFPKLTQSPVISSFFQGNLRHSAACPMWAFMSAISVMLPLRRSHPVHIPQLFLLAVPFLRLRKTALLSERSMRMNPKYREGLRRDCEDRKENRGPSGSSSRSCMTGKPRWKTSKSSTPSALWLWTRIKSCRSCLP